MSENDPDIVEDPVYREKVAEFEVHPGWRLIYERRTGFLDERNDLLRLVWVAGRPDRDNDRWVRAYATAYMSAQQKRLDEGKPIQSMWKWADESQLQPAVPATPAGPAMIGLMVNPRDLKMLRETLCRLEVAARYLYPETNRHLTADLNKLINEIDRHRPLGPDGKHGNLHTASCGCEDKPHPWKAPKMCPSNPCRAKDCRKQHDD